MTIRFKTIRASLLEARTPQEFLVQMGFVADNHNLTHDETSLMILIRDALGEVMNRTTPTWMPCTVENMHKALGTTPASEEKR